jgi:hypothetical protein
MVRAAGVQAVCLCNGAQDVGVVGHDFIGPDAREWSVLGMEVAECLVLTAAVGGLAEPEVGKGCGHVCGRTVAETPLCLEETKCVPKDKEAQYSKVQ